MTNIAKHNRSVRLLPVKEDAPAGVVYRKISVLADIRILSSLAGALPVTAKQQFIYLHCSGILLPFPLPALLDPRSVRGVPVFRIAGIPRQQLTGYIRTLSAMHQSLFLTAGCHRTLSMKGSAIRLDTAAAVTAVLIFASRTVKSAARVNDRTAYRMIHNINLRFSAIFYFFPS